MQRKKNFASEMGTRLIWVWSVLALCAMSTAEAQDLSRFFKDTPGAFVLYDLKTGRYLRYNEARCRKRFSPFSTFKIPNALIGIETKVITNADTVLQWEPERYPESVNWTEPPAVHWKQDHTLRSSMKYSVVWYYRELARRVGEQRMRQMVSQFGYGNQEVSGGWDSPRLFDAFWLSGSLRISADEQIEFLRRFYAGKLSISKRSTSIVKDILVMEKTYAYTLSGKTGGGSLANDRALGWFVGYVETKDNVYFFAANIEGPSFAAIRDRRIELTKQILTERGCLPRRNVP
jgi:beta-lactamase class D